MTEPAAMPANPPSTVAMGIVGCGHIAATHAAILREQPGVILARVCDLDAAKAQAFANRFGAASWTTDLAEITRDPAITAVYLCTMHHARLAPLTALVAAGKAIFCEKPLTHDLTSLRALAKLLASHPQCRFWAGYKTRFHTLMGRAMSLLPTPELLHAQVHDDPWPAGPLTDPAMAGGNVPSQGVYAADALHLLAGAAPVSVTAMAHGRRHGAAHPDRLVASFRFANGVLGTLNVGDAGVTPVPSSKFFVSASGAGLGLTLSQRFTQLDWQVPRQPVRQETHAEDGFVRQTQAFLAAVRGQGPLLCDFRQGAIPSLMIWQALAAAQAGRELPVPNADCLTTENTEHTE